MYAKYVKRGLDFLICLCAVIVLSPLLLALTCVGAVAMRGNPFFVQERPGLHGKLFKIIKFRTMSMQKGPDGRLLPDEIRLNRYGRFLRSSSLDELPELFNIIKGDMSIIGPRPLAKSYLAYYTEEEQHRHDVRPGLSGLAQVHGRNSLDWSKRFQYDLEYVRSVSFKLDLQIVLMTVLKVIRREGIGQGEDAPVSLSAERKKIDRQTQKDL